MKSIGFLFGAGAEACFGLPNGREYFNQTFLYSAEQNELLSDAIMEKFNIKKYYLQNYPGLYLNLLRNECILLLKNNPTTIEDIGSICFNLFTKDGLKDLITEFTNIKIDNNAKYYDAVIKKISDFEKTYDENRDSIEKTRKSLVEKYKKFTSNNQFDIYDNSISEDERKIFEVLRHTELKSEATAGILDKLFHTIVEPKKYGINNYCRLFNYYWSCYFCIVKSILYFFDRDIEGFYEKKSKKINYRAILEDIETFSKKLYGLDYTEIKNCYYDEIRKKLDEEKSSVECSGIITTNYFNFAEKILNIDNVAYPNGKLNLFELPMQLEVRDALDDISLGKKNAEKKSMEFFPFIFGQSFVKPIIHKTQIDEFSKIAKILCIESNDKTNKLDCLVVLGYNINPDDNHINSYLHEYVNKGGRILFVTNKSEEIAKKDLESKLHLEECDSIKILTVDYKKLGCEKIVTKIFESL